MALADELCAIQADATLGISTGRANAASNTWLLWHQFCCSLHQDPTLQAVDDPIPLLRLFARRYRTGIIAPSGGPVRSRTVEEALRAVGQTIATLGSRDPRLQPSGKLDIRLARQLKAYKRVDPPPHRVKPVPLPIITHAAQLCRLANTAQAHTIADMLLLGFYFLLRPGEYAHTDNPDSTPFRLCDVHLLRGPMRLNTYTASEADLRSATHVALEFTHQKNGVQGELIGLGRSGDPQWCPVLAVINRVLHFRTHRAPRDTPLYSYFATGAWHVIRSSVLTQHLRAAAQAMGAASGITAADISVRSLRSSGAMALLCAAVDPDKIRLLGRWRSDEMLRYLHVQAFPIIASFAAQMLLHGHFALIPNNRLP